MGVIPCTIPQLPRLRSLHIDGNPVASRPDLVSRVCSAFAELITLNGEAVVLHEVMKQNGTKKQRLVCVELTSGPVCQLLHDRTKAAPSSDAAASVGKRQQQPSGTSFSQRSTPEFDLDAFLIQQTQTLRGSCRLPCFHVFLSSHIWNQWRHLQKSSSNAIRR